MSETFHKFPKLPFELRTQIWELATRSTTPGIYFFRVENSARNKIIKRGDELIFDKQCYKLHPSAPAIKHEFRGGASGDETAVSPPPDHQSTELFDGGLWTACKESRLVMQRKFKSEVWKAAQKDLENKRHECRCLYIVPPPQDMTPSAGYFVTDDGKRHFFTSFLHQEVFCMQPRSLKSFNWYKVNFQVPVESNFRWDRGPKHIAIEFDPAWGAALEGLTPMEGSEVRIIKKFVHIVYQASSSCELDTFWFIDYSLKRKPFVPMDYEAPQLDDGRVFQSGNYRFREVLLRDAYRLNRDEITPSFVFQDALSCGIIRRIETSNAEQRRVALDDMYWEDGYPAQIGILACEHL